MSNAWLEQSISEVLAEAQAAGMPPAEVATKIHAGKFSLDHVPGVVGYAVAAAIVSRHLPDEIREREQAERARRDAEEGQKASTILWQILAILHTWESLPEEQRVAKAVGTRRQTLEAWHGVIAGVDGEEDHGAWARRPGAQEIYLRQKH